MIAMDLFLSQERVDPARSENYAQDRRRLFARQLFESSACGTHTTRAQSAKSGRNRRSPTTTIFQVSFGALIACKHQARRSIPELACLEKASSGLVSRALPLLSVSSKPRLLSFTACFGVLCQQGKVSQAGGGNWLSRPGELA